MEIIRRLFEVLLYTIALIFFIPFVVVYTFIWMPLHYIYRSLIYIITGYIIEKCDDGVSVYLRICHLE